MKAQVAVEYIVFVGIILLIFSLASYAVIMTEKDVNEENEIIEARNTATVLAYEINLAGEIGDGYSHKFYLPEYIRGINYSVNVSNDMNVQISWNNKSYSLPITSQNVTNSAKKGLNIIKNVDGAIVFE